MTAVEEEVGRYVDILGTRTFYITAGTGAPVVLFHGGAPGTCTLVQWRFTIKPLAEAGFAVYAYDQPGAGLSEPAAEGSMDLREAHALACLDAWGIERAHLIGNSIGAYVAARLAIEHPERVAKLVIAAGTGLGPPGSPENEERARTFAQLLRDYTPSLANMRELFGAVVYHQELITDELVQLRYDMSLRALAAQQARPAGGGGGMRPLVDELKDIQAKTLVVWGAQDQSSTTEKALLVAQAIPGAELHIFDQCAHWVMWDHAARFNTLVADFLSGP